MTYYVLAEWQKYADEKLQNEFGWKRLGFGRWQAPDGTKAYYVSTANDLANMKAGDTLYLLPGYDRKYRWRIIDEMTRDSGVIRIVAP